MIQKSFLPVSRQHAKFQDSCVHFVQILLSENSFVRIYLDCWLCHGGILSTVGHSCSPGCIGIADTDNCLSRQLVWFIHISIEKRRRNHKQQQDNHDDIQNHVLYILRHGSYFCVDRPWLVLSDPLCLSNPRFIDGGIRDFFHHVQSLDGSNCRGACGWENLNAYTGTYGSCGNSVWEISLVEWTED